MDSIEDEELLYRNIPADRRRYAVEPDGTLRFSSEAFLDRARTPSVDRAKLCNNDPSHTQIDPDDGVTSLLTVDVRAIQDIGKRDKKGNLIPPPYLVDVVSDPISGDITHKENLAHALIVTTPPCNESQFIRLRRSLARLAGERGWMIAPKDLR